MFDSLESSEDDEAPRPPENPLQLELLFHPRNRSLSWRDVRFSDWTVLLGERTYQLHAYILARASVYFNHISERDVVRSTELTYVLPVSCHASFEIALDFIYSENQVTFEVPPSKALLLLRIAEILGISRLFEAMSLRIESTFSETAPLFLEQYYSIHCAGEDDGAALRQIRDGALELIAQKFQPFLASPEMRAALLRLPGSALAAILGADDLAVASEDVVFDFVQARWEANADAAGSDLCEVDTWSRVRWPHVSATRIAKVLSRQSEIVRHALTCRVEESTVMSRHPILPPGVPQPTSTEIDFCFHYPRLDYYVCGEALRSQPRRIGDLVLRVLVFPSGTDTGVARGSLSVFLEAVPQSWWPPDWEFTNIRYAITCIRWPSGSGGTWAANRKSDLWTFKTNRLDRGWHDFLAPGEVHRYVGGDGFVCLRGSLESECLGRTFLLHSQATYSGPGDAAGSSARRLWPRPVPGVSE